MKLLKWSVGDPSLSVFGRTSFWKKMLDINQESITPEEFSLKTVPYMYALINKVAALEHFAKFYKNILSRVFSQAESL